MITNAWCWSWVRPPVGWSSVSGSSCSSHSYRHSSCFLLAPHLRPPRHRNQFTPCCVCSGASPTDQNDKIPTMLSESTSRECEQWHRCSFLCRRFDWRFLPDCWRSDAFITRAERLEPESSRVSDLMGPSKSEETHQTLRIWWIIWIGLSVTYFQLQVLMRKHSWEASRKLSSLQKLHLNKPVASQMSLWSQQFTGHTFLIKGNQWCGQLFKNEIIANKSKQIFSFTVWHWHNLTVICNNKSLIEEQIKYQF